MPSKRGAAEQRQQVFARFGPKKAGGDGRLTNLLVDEQLAGDPGGADLLQREKG